MGSILGASLARPGALPAGFTKTCLIVAAADPASNPALLLNLLDTFGPRCKLQAGPSPHSSTDIEKSANVSGPHLRGTRSPPVES